MDRLTIVIPETKEFIQAFKEESKQTGSNNITLETKDEILHRATLSAGITTTLEYGLPEQSPIFAEASLTGVIGLMKNDSVLVEKRERVQDNNLKIEASTKLEHDFERLIQSLQQSNQVNK